MKLSRRIFTGLAVAASLGFSVFGTAEAQTSEKSKITVFAAASMKNALDTANKAWVAKGNPEITVSYAASSTLANQIEKGAPADIFISADLDWMNYLKDKNLMKPEATVNFLGNRLVIVAPKDKSTPIDIKPGFDIVSRIGGGKIAMGTVDAVPAGKYGKAAFEKLGVWGKVSGHVAQTDSVRAALLLVSRGEAELGVVYQTDAAADKNVTIVGKFPEDSHPAIIYPIGISASSTNPDDTAYVAFLRSQEARPFFEEQGFTVLPATH